MRSPRTLSRTLVLACTALIAASCGGSVGSVAPPTPSGAPGSPAAGPTLLWPAPSDPLERTVAAGLEPGPKEFHVKHVHAHLDVFIDGELYQGDPREIEITERKVIVVVVGTPPAVIPSTADFSNA